MSQLGTGTISIVGDVRGVVGDLRGGLSRRSGGPSRIFRSSILAIVVAVLAFAFAASAQAAPTTVSLTFDDGNADLMNAVPIMQQKGVKGTFYIISGVVGAPNYVTRANLSTIAGAGNEIGGHTVSHPDLTTVPSDEATRQICNDRVSLTNWGFPVTSFAYPYTAFNSSVETIAKNCGYNSARTLGDIKSAHSDPGVTDLSGAIPPVDAYNLPAVDQIDNTWTLAQMKAVVTNAEAVGGWVIFTFHHICSGAGCDSLSITPTNFTSFVTWLKTRPATTSVKTINQVIGGTVKPAVAGPPATTTTLVNPSLETLQNPGDTFPACWMPGGWGSNTPTWTRTADAHSGSFAEGLGITGYASGDAKLLPTFDTGGCSPAVTPGRTYNLGTWYKSTGTTQFALYYRDSAGAWFYWTSSPWFAAASNWTQATWTTPAAPAGATGMSFGLALIANGSLTTDDYTLAPSGGAARNLAAALVAAPGVTSPAAGIETASQTRKKPRHARKWGKRDRPFLPGEKHVKPGTRVVPPFMSDGDTTTG